MNQPQIHAVTGAFGYSGRYITRRLLALGKSVRTLTNSPDRNGEFQGRIDVSAFHFDASEKLADALNGVSVLYNTYWVRFNHKSFQHSIAVENTLKLFEAAKKAGVQRIVHTSITNPSENSDLEYFSGKAILEKALIESGISYTILRPTVLFGEEDILINNIVWLLRRFPVFGIFGDGKYKLQPIYVDDFAELAVEKGTQNPENATNEIINAIGPETWEYKEMIADISQIVLGKKRPMITIPDFLGYAVGKAVGLFVGDVVITKEEIRGLKENLLYVDAPPVGATKLTDWLQTHRDTVGTKYTSELARRKN